MNVSFQGMDELVLTFKAAGGLEKGDFVKVTDNGTVGPCAGGDAPLGVALNVRNGFAAVQVRGFVEAEYTGTLALGGFISSSALIMRMPLFIPIVGFIMLIIWAVGGSPKFPARRNWAIAQFILMAIFIALGIIFTAIAGLTFGSIMSSGTLS